MQYKLHPQLGYLVLYDKEQLVVMRGFTEWLLCIQQLIQVQVTRVGQATSKIELD
jgi:hypothetical protein